MSTFDDLAPVWAIHLPGGVDWRDVDLLAAGSLPAAWSARWRAEPERLLVHDEITGWLTAGDLLAQSARVAGRFAGAGLRRGDRILLSGPATHDFVIAHVAAMRAGLVGIPVNSASTDPELEALIDAAAPKAAVLGSAALREVAVRRRPGLDRGRHRRRPARWRSARTRCRHRIGPRPASLHVGHDRGAQGRRAVPRQPAGERRGDPARVALDRGRPPDPVPAAVPHARARRRAARHAAGRWAPCSCRIASIPSTVLAAAADATMFFGVPTMYARLVEADRPDRLGTLRLCVSGSAPLTQ